MPEPSRLNKYTTAVLDECEAWLDEQGARYWHASAVPPTVRWVLPQHGTRRRREWELSFGCNPHDLRSWRVCLAERDRRGNVYDTREEFVGRSELCATAHRLTTAGLEYRRTPTGTCGHRFSPGFLLLSRLRSLGGLP